MLCVDRPNANIMKDVGVQCGGRLSVELISVFSLSLNPSLSLYLSLSLQLSICHALSTSPAHKYYLAMDPLNEVLYVSDTSSRRVYRLRTLTEPRDLARNMEVVAGTGEQCTPFHQNVCGDGGKAADASLSNPRGAYA